MNILVKDSTLLEDYLSSVLKLIQACKFEINSEGCIVNGIHDSRTIRAFFSSNVITCDEDITFCLNDLQKLHSSIQTINSFKEDKDSKEITLEFDETFIRATGNVKFKLRVIKEEVIERNITTPINVELKPIFGCTLHNTLIKKLCGVSSINSSENPKVYLAKMEDHIFGEIDDKQVKISDSIGIPLTRDYFGEWNTVLVTKLDVFRLWNLLGSQTIDVAMTDKKVLQINNRKEEGDLFININIISAVLKG